MKLKPDRLPTGFLVIFIIFNATRQLRMIITTPDHITVHFIPFASAGKEHVPTEEWSMAGEAHIPEIIRNIETRCRDNEGQPRKLKKTDLDDHMIQIWKAL